MAAAEEEGRRLAEGADVRRLLGLVVGASVSAVIPQSWDAVCVGGVHAWLNRFQPATLARIEAKMRAALPPEPGFDAAAAADAFLRMYREDAWGRMRGVRRFGWRPSVRLEGLEKLDQVLARGRGAVLWGLRLASATAIKQAFHQAGRPLVHLSRAQHGSPTESRLGVGVVAPLYCRAENPYLAERIVIPLDGSLGYLRTVRDRLGRNAAVSIFAEHSGRQNIVARVLTADLEFAVGAPSLAWLEGAALLSVSAHREGPFTYRIVIADEIPVDRSTPRKEFAVKAVQELARRLEALIIRYPSDWQGWMYREFPSEAGRQSGVSG